MGEFPATRGGGQGLKGKKSQQVEVELCEADKRSLEPVPRDERS